MRVVGNDAFLVYIMYMNEGKEEGQSVARAREHFPALLEAAEAGIQTVISRRGRPVAVLGPLSLRKNRSLHSLESLVGTGRGLWGDAAVAHVEILRQEWD